MNQRFQQISPPPAQRTSPVAPLVNYPPFPKSSLPGLSPASVSHRFSSLSVECRCPRVCTHAFVEISLATANPSESLKNYRRAQTSPDRLYQVHPFRHCTRLPPTSSSRSRSIVLATLFTSCLLRPSLYRLWPNETSPLRCGSFPGDFPRPSYAASPHPHHAYFLSAR